MPFILAGFKVDKNGARWTGKIIVNLGDLSKASGRKGVFFFCNTSNNKWQIFVIITCSNCFLAPQLILWAQTMAIKTQSKTKGIRV